MSDVKFIADLHLGHANIAKFEGYNRGGVTNVEEHDAWIIEQWNSVVKKGDLVWVLGDVAFTKEGLDKVRQLNGFKHLILGNHDTFSLDLYRNYFNRIHGFIKKYNFWLSHAPIRDCSLRGIVNVHGHIHSGETNSSRHICVSVEKLNGCPVSIRELRKIYD